MAQPPIEPRFIKLQDSSGVYGIDIYVYTGYNTFYESPEGRKEKPRGYEARLGELLVDSPACAISFSFNFGENAVKKWNEQVTITKKQAAELRDALNSFIEAQDSSPYTIERVPANSVDIVSSTSSEKRSRKE